MTNQEYSDYVQKKAKSSPSGKNLLWAFSVGGLICTVGQLLFIWYQSMGASEEDAGLMVSITLIAASALLTGLRLYDKLARYAGAGTLVPITGFANSVAAPAMEFKSEGLITGMAAKLFTIAGPVIVFGISASIAYGLILLLLGKGG